MGELSSAIDRIRHALTGNGHRRLRAIISDVHGNLESLREVLKDIADQGATEVVCLGDTVGYGPEPVRCLKLIRRITFWTICGNHDAGMFMPCPVGFREVAVRALKDHRRVMEPGFFSIPSKVARWHWLSRLPSYVKEDRALYVHGSPRDYVMDYVLEQDFEGGILGPSQKAEQMFDGFDWACFVGHSHRPGIATHEFKWIRPEELPSGTYRLPRHDRTIVNVGSVGQPRDGDSKACYVLFDGECVRFRRVEYDIEATQLKIQDNPELDDQSSIRLALGR